MILFNFNRLYWEVCMLARSKNYYSASSFLPVSRITPDSRKQTINCFLMTALFCVVKTKA
jgi:hypothetical protein